MAQTAAARLFGGKKASTPATTSATTSSVSRKAAHPLDGKIKVNEVGKNLYLLVEVKDGKQLALYDGERFALSRAIYPEAWIEGDILHVKDKAGKEFTKKLDDGAPEELSGDVF